MSDRMPWHRWLASLICKVVGHKDRVWVERTGRRRCARCLTWLDEA